jgi:hypothetical protein|tara:strand:- start:701 stop:1282 length:582 start_codon:yes stop_codon:yes gene_type:complete
MSRLAFRSSTPAAAESHSFVPTTTHHIVLEATVRPVGANDYEATRVSEQARILNQLRSNGKDIFEMNETREVQSTGTTLYQTTEMYGTAMSIENIIETMKPADLTLRVNFNRPGTHSNTTCMALSSETLEKLLKTTADATGNKIAEIRVSAESSAKVPRHGAFYVAIAQKGTQHYLSHIDYKIMTQYDKMYHE